MSLRTRLRLYMRIGILQGMLDEMGHDPNVQGYAFVMKDLSRCRQALDQMKEERPNEFSREYQTIM